MFVFKAMIKIDIMNSWFPFFFINQLIFGEGWKNAFIREACDSTFHFLFSRYVQISIRVENPYSSRVVCRVLLPLKKYSKFCFYIGLTKRRCIMGWPSAWSWVWGVGRTVRRSRAFIEKKCFPNYGPNLVWSKSLEFFSFSNYQQFFFWKIPHGRTTKLCNLIGSREISVGLQTFCTC